MPPARVVEIMRDIQGVDGTMVRLSERHFLVRDRRLRGNKLFPAFHQTGMQGCRGIVSSNQMRPGSSGIAGGGIYFASDVADTDHKMAGAEGGFMFRCCVLLGNVDEWPATKIDSRITFKKLNESGFDSVHIPRPGGDEFIVYSHDQVELCEVVRWYHPPQGKGPRGAVGNALGPWVPVRDLQENSHNLDCFLAGDDSRWSRGDDSRGGDSRGDDSRGDDSWWSRSRGHHGFSGHASRPGTSSASGGHSRSGRNGLRRGR